nr:MAG TPA: homing endonuclease [Bacteriophage sp.]
MGLKETIYPNIYVENEDVYKKKHDGTFHKLSKWKDSVGYYQVVFRINGKKIYKRVHRLIAETFLENPNNLPMVNHIDGNKLNNALTNLEWCTNAHNVQEAYNRKLYKSTYKCTIKAISKETLECIEFRSIRECAKVLGLNRKTLTEILKGNKTNNYGYEFEYV